MADTPIPIADLPTVIPGEYDYVVVAQLGNARKALAPEVTAAAAALSVGLDGLLATKGAEFDADAAVVLTSLGYLPPVLYAAGISLTSTHQTVERNGAIYAPLAAQLPFTTSGTFETAKFRLIQGQGSSMSGTITYTGGDGIFLKVDGDNLDPSVESRDFNFSVVSNPGANGVGVRGNSVARMGWNMASNGTREDPTDAACYLSFEQHYFQSGEFAFEVHLEGQTTAGVPFRPMGFFIPKDGSKIDMTLQLGTLTANRSDGTLALLWNLDTGEFYTSGAIEFPGNNVPTLKQRNAANTAYLNLPYFNVDNRMQLEGSIHCFGGASATDSVHPKTFLYFGCNATNADTIFLDMIAGGSITGSAHAGRFVGIPSADWKLEIWNQRNSSGANAVLQLHVASVTAGDPKTVYTIEGDASSWQAGVDNSDSSIFKWSRGALGTSVQASLTIDGHFTVAGSLKPKSYTLAGATSALAATLGAGAIIYVSNESGGAVMAFSDGTNWKRVTDRATIS